MKNLLKKLARKIQKNAGNPFQELTRAERDAMADRIMGRVAHSPLVLRSR